MNFTKGLRAVPYVYTLNGTKSEGVAIFRGSKLVQFLPSEDAAMKLADQIVDVTETLRKRT